MRGRRATHLVTGYVHKAYPRVYALLAREAGFDSALVVRGVEGGVVPSLRQSGKATYYHVRGPEEMMEFNPADWGVEQALRAPPLPGAHGDDNDDEEIPFDTVAIANAAAEAGVAALRGARGPTRDALVSAGALCLWHLRRSTSLAAAANTIREVLDNGAVRARIGR